MKWENCKYRTLVYCRTYLIARGKRLSDSLRHFALVLLVHLVADQDLVHLHHQILPKPPNKANLSVSVLFDFSKPFGQAVERWLRGDIVHQHDGVSTTVVRLSDRPEALLSGRVPDLQLHLVLANVHALDHKVDADRRRLTGREDSLCELTDETSG